MTRVEEMKKDGFKLVIYGLDKQIFATYENVKSFYRDYLGKWIIFGMKDENIIDEFTLKDFYDYSIITRAKY